MTTSLKDAVLKLREDVLLAAEENEQRTMQKCAQTLLAASGLKMLASRMEKGAGINFFKDIRKEGIGAAVKDSAKHMGREAGG